MNGGQMRRQLIAVAVLMLGLGISIRAAAPDWPQFRGPNRDDLSRETGLLKEWPREGPEQLWKSSGIGSGYSSVSIAGNRIYTLGNKGNITNLHVLDRETGKLLWSVPVGKAGGNLGCTPTVDGDRVFTIGQAGDLACVDTTTKKIVWRKNFVTDFAGKFGGWQYCESPLVDGDKLVCTPGGKEAILATFDKKTGEVLWKTPSPFGEHTAGYASIVVANVGNVRQYVQLTQGGLLGVSAKDGKVLWSYEKLGRNTANIPTPIVLGDHVFSSAGYGKGAALLKLVPDGDGIDAREVYFKRELTNKHGGLLIVGDHVYGDSDDRGLPFCAEVKTGKVLWRRTTKGRSGGSAAVTYADGHLYFLYQEGDVALVKASADSYQEVGRFKVKAGGQAWAHPVVAGGKLYLRGNDVLYCYDVKAK